MTNTDGGVTAPRGFLAAGVAAGIKPGSTKKDCALIVSETPAAVAGVFTRNVVKAAPVVWDQQVCVRGNAQAVFINSGNANAATGPQGVTDCQATAQAVAEAVQSGFEAEDVCVCSTGVIGVPLPMDRIRKGVAQCVAAISDTGGVDAAEAIMTTDTVPKELAMKATIGGGTVVIGAMAKGAGMIAPNMATMLCFVTTDAEIDSETLHDALSEAVDASFNRICIDNDMSTNDTVLCLANGTSEVRLEPDSDELAEFTAMLTVVCQDLAKRLVKDGEGATKFVEIEVDGAESDQQARMIAKSIATSMLTKTAFFGQDPNWGRIICAAGYAGVDFDPSAISLWLDDLQLVANGVPTQFAEEDAARRMQQPEFVLRLCVGSGEGKAWYWTSDLSHDYVTINADYRT